MRFRLSGEKLPGGFARGRGVHHAPRHDLRRELHRHLARASAGAGAGEKRSELPAFIEECRKIGTAQEEIDRAEKKGYATPACVAAHPFRSSTKLPVYVANFILMDYGTGAIFGCPAHDQRDLDFARKYKLKVKAVVVPPRAKTRQPSRLAKRLTPGQANSPTPHS